MAKITSVDSFLGRGAVDWLEFRWGEQHPITCRLVNEQGGVDTPVDLGTHAVTVTAEEITVDVASVAPSRAAPAGSVQLSNPQLLEPPVSIGVAITTINAADGRFSFITPDPTAVNPDFDGDTLPALVIWIRYVDGAGNEDQTALGIFFRRGVK